MWVGGGWWVWAGRWQGNTGAHPRDDDVGVLLRRGHVGVEHGLDELGVLFDHACNPAEIERGRGPGGARERKRGAWGRKLRGVLRQLPRRIRLRTGGCAVWCAGQDTRDGPGRRGGGEGGLAGITRGGGLQQRRGSIGEEENKNENKNPARRPVPAADTPSPRPSPHTALAPPPARVVRLPDRPMGQGTRKRSDAVRWSRGAPFTSRPRSIVSRLILRARRTSSSVSTNIFMLHIARTSSIASVCRERIGREKMFVTRQSSSQFAGPRAWPIALTE